MSTVRERKLDSHGAPIGTLVYTLGPDQFEEGPFQRLLPPMFLADESWTPLFESGLGSTSILFDCPVTIGTKRVSRDIASEEILENGQRKWRSLTAIADALEREVATLGAIRHAAKFPNFKALEEYGWSAKMIALERLSGECRPLWLYFLQSTTDDRPAAGRDTVDGAVAAWRQWGFQTGLL